MADLPPLYLSPAALHEKDCQGLSSVFTISLLFSIPPPQPQEVQKMTRLNETV